MIEPILHHIWIGGEPDPFLVACRESFLDAHPSWTHMYHRDPASILNDTYPHEALAPEHLWHFWEVLSRMSNPKRVSLQCDLLKMLCVWKYGGIYVDHDQYCIRPFDKFLSDPYVFAYVNEFCFVGENIIGAPKGDPAILGIARWYVHFGIWKHVKQASLQLSNWCLRHGERMYNCIHNEMVFCPSAMGEPEIYRHDRTTHSIHCYYRTKQYDLNKLAEIAENAQKDDGKEADLSGQRGQTSTGDSTCKRST